MIKKIILIEWVNTDTMLYQLFLFFSPKLKYATPMVSAVAIAVYPFF
jgi:hypothetical protein